MRTVVKRLGGAHRGEIGQDIGCKLVGGGFHYFEGVKEGIFEVGGSDAWVELEKCDGSDCHVCNWTGEVVEE